MKKLVLGSISALMYVTVIFAQVNLPAPSSTQMIRQDFGMGRIELTYSRPSLKGRSVFQESSDLAPLGKIWRTGANSATKIRITDKVVIGGTEIDSGTYALYTIPAKDQWDIILNRGVSNWGIDGYKQNDDIVKFKVAASKGKGNVETFTMQFANVKPESCELHIMWGDKAIQIPISTNIKERLRIQIETALQGERKPYQQAASYYYEWEKDYAKALENINKAIEAYPKGFYLYLTRAKIQKDMGDKQGAKVSAAKCIEMATIAKNDDYVNQANDFLKGI